MHSLLNHKSFYKANKGYAVTYKLLSLDDIDTMMDSLKKQNHGL